MEKFKMAGTIEAVGPVQTVGQGGFRKREVVVCDDPDAEHPHRLVWELTQDKVSLLDGSAVGARVVMEGWPESRSWKDRQGNVRWFTSMKALGASVSAPPKAVELIPDKGPAEDSAGEDMPF